MTSSESKAALCAICGKAAGNFTCRGCAQDFCTKHVGEHRQALGKKMDEIMLEHDQLRESLTERAETLTPHVIMKQINEWEEESIKAIHRAAAESRNQLRNIFDKCKNKITQILEPIGHELKKSYDDDTFVETDLTEWTRKLEELKKELTMPPTVNIETDCHGTSFINRLSVIEIPDDIFQESVGNIRIEENGKVITHGFWGSYGAARGRGEYSSGRYRFTFKLEGFDKESTHGFFFGIVSKVIPLQQSTLSANTTCGWTISADFLKRLDTLLGGEDQKYRNGSTDENMPWKIKKNDIFELIINCDGRKIHLTNKQTNKVDEGTIDVDQYPFPWCLNFSLYNWYERIRLLPI